MRLRALLQLGSGALAGSPGVLWLRSAHASCDGSALVEIVFVDSHWPADLSLKVVTSPAVCAWLVALRVGDALGDCSRRGAELNSARDEETVSDIGRTSLYARRISRGAAARVYGFVGFMVLFAPLDELAKRGTPTACCSRRRFPPTPSVRPRLSGRSRASGLAGNEHIQGQREMLAHHVEFLQRQWRLGEPGERRCPAGRTDREVSRTPFVKSTPG